MFLAKMDRDYCMNGTRITPKIMLLVVPLLLVVNCGREPGASDASTLVFFFAGDTKVHREGTSLRPTVKMPLERTDRLVTGESSSMTVQCCTDILFKILEDSEIRVSTLENNRVTELDLEKGTVISRLTRSYNKKRTFLIRTKTTTVAVRGTEFSVSVDEVKVTVAVKSGKVLVTRTADSRQQSVESGNTAVISPDSLKIRDISEIELLQIEKLSHVEITGDPEKVKPAALQSINKTIKEKDAEIDQKIEKLRKKNRLPATLQEIREKYGFVQVISMYTGRRIQGYVLARGKRFKILVPGRIIYVNGDDVENVQRM
jgi:hypothetical protein